MLLSGVAALAGADRRGIMERLALAVACACECRPGCFESRRCEAGG